MRKRSVFCLITLITALAVSAKDRPNVLFIMSDDHTAQAGAYATVLKPLNPTPTLDQLAAEGMVFDNVFCSNSICTPSRASIITGQYPHVNGVTDLTGLVMPAKQTLPILFSKAGYQTAMIGKRHLKVEPNFDYYKVLPGQGRRIPSSVCRATSRGRRTSSPTRANIPPTPSPIPTLHWFKTA